MRLLIASLTLATALLGGTSTNSFAESSAGPYAGVTAAMAAGSHVGGRPQPANGTWPLRPRPVVAELFLAPASAWGSGHRGVDLVGAVGQPVRAALPGTVGFVGSIAGRGVVVVRHGGTRTTYEPVAATVRVGDRVGAGATIGRLELRGSHCFPVACLHLGWLRDETYLDPLLLVDAGPVRLLPLDRVHAPAGTDVLIRPRRPRPVLPYDGWWGQARG